MSKTLAISMQHTMVSYGGMYFGRMLSPIGQNVFLCCSKFKFFINDVMTLLVSHTYRHWRSRLSPDLIAVTHVLLELISVHEGVFSVSVFGDFIVKQLNLCICTS